MNGFLVIAFSFLTAVTASAQNTVSYRVTNDSPKHTTVIHLGNEEKVKIFDRQNTHSIARISPEIKIANGMVEHKGMTGDILAKEYFVKNQVIGYVEYNGQDILRELYYNADGNIYLEKRYDKGNLIYTNGKVQKMKVH